MAKTDFKSVDAYLATMPEATRAVLEEVRGIIRKTIPDAEEVISYQIPAYKKDGATIIYFAGWKTHFSLYPVGDAFAEAFPKEAARYPRSKGTIKFALDDKVPAKLIARIVRMRVKAEAAEVKAKRAKRAG